MRVTNSWWRLAVLAGLVASAAACSPEQSENDAIPGLTPPSVANAPQLDSVLGLTLPTEAYQPSPTQQETVDVATDHLIAQCMAGFGFTWEVRDHRRPPIVRMARMYGIGDLERAKAYGYHFLPEEKADATVRDRREAAATGPYVPEDPDLLLVLSGSPDGVSRVEDPGTYGGQQVPVGGCAGEALRQLGIENLDAHLVDTIGGNAFEASRADSRVVEVVAAWSACMKQKGYVFADPFEPAGGWDMDNPATDQEIQTAVDDVMCKQQTNLIGVWYTIQVAYEDQLIQQNILALSEFQQAWVDATGRATQVVGTST